MTKYNGFKNYETWNVALWIQNDESYHVMAKTSRDYYDFVEGMAMCGIGEHRKQTPDGVMWTDKALDFAELEKLIKEIRGH